MQSFSRVSFSTPSSLFAAGLQNAENLPSNFDCLVPRKRYWIEIVGDNIQLRSKILEAIKREVSRTRNETRVC